MEKSGGFRGRTHSEGRSWREGDVKVVLHTTHTSNCLPETNMMCHHLSSDDTQDLQVWSRSGLKNTGFWGHLTCWYWDSLFFFLVNVRTKSDKPVWQVNWVQPFLSSLPLNSCHLLYGRHCKFMQYPLQPLLINLLVLRSQKMENYISQTPLQVRGPKWTYSGLTGRSDPCVVAAKCRRWGALADEVLWPMR